MTEIKSAVSRKKILVKPIELSFSVGVHNFRVETVIDPLFVTTTLYVPVIQAENLESLEGLHEQGIVIAKKAVLTYESMYAEVEAQHNKTIAKVEQVQDALYNPCPNFASLIKPIAIDELTMIHAEALSCDELLLRILQDGYLVIGSGWSESEIKGENLRYYAIIRTKLGEIRMEFVTTGDIMSQHGALIGMQIKSAQVFKVYSSDFLFNVPAKAIEELNKQTKQFIPNSMRVFMENKLSIPVA